MNLRQTFPSLRRGTGRFVLTLRKQMPSKGKCLLLVQSVWSQIFSCFSCVAAICLFNYEVATLPNRLSTFIFGPTRVLWGCVLCKKVKNNLDSLGPICLHKVFLCGFPIVALCTWVSDIWRDCVAVGTHTWLLCCPPASTSLFPCNMHNVMGSST